MKPIPKFYLIIATLAFNGAALMRADEVVDWNRNMLSAALAANANPLVQARAAALVHSAVFDAVNGIERRFSPVHVEPAAPAGASQRAAAIQAAHGILTKMFPAQQLTLDAQLAGSLTALWGDNAVQNSQSIRRGRDWGQSVADAIWAWRSTDGFATAVPPFLGSLAVGQWRPTPPGFLPGAAPQIATMMTWAIQSPSQFRTDGPPALDSVQYAEDFEETRLMGSVGSLLRTSDETLAALFWNTSAAPYPWNSVAEAISEERHLTLSENARLFALLNLAIVDAVVACWDAKYTYNSWRPVTAIALADTDGNPATVAEPGWTPLFITPNH